MPNAPKLPNGVHLRGNSLVIDFRYRNQRCRETLKNLKPTASNIKFAERKRAAILHEIAQGTFDYAHHFPDSRRAQLFSGPGASRKTVSSALDEWLSLCEGRNSAHTLDVYRSWTENHVRPKFGKRPLRTITTTDIELWHGLELADASPATVRAVTQPLRAIFDRAKKDRIIDSNPMEDVTYPQADQYEEPDPFTREEMEQLLATPFDRRSEMNMVAFALWSGLRINELIALAWEDIDWVQGLVHIRRAKDPKQYKMPKTTRSVRKVELLTPARDALQRQRALSEARPPVTISIRQRGNARFRKEQVRFVFLNTLSGLHFNSTDQYRNVFWYALMRKCPVRTRGPYTTRHTFISQMLTANMPKEWIIRQVGHKDSKMIDEHYGKWIREDAPNMASAVDQHFGFGHTVVTKDQKK